MKRIQRMKMTQDMRNEIVPPSPQRGEIVLYQPDETVRLEVRLEDETVWLTQAQMAELFEKDQSVIARHIGNIFREGELEEVSNMQTLHNTQEHPNTSVTVRDRSIGKTDVTAAARACVWADLKSFRTNKKTCQKQPAGIQKLGYVSE